MNAKKIITTLFGTVIAFFALATSISVLSRPTTPETSLDPVFISSQDDQKAVLSAGAIISEKGSLQFGDFALIQLTAEESSLEFISAEFSEDMGVIQSARGRVNSGSILAVNLLFGNELTLLDDRTAVVSHGGSFIFEKNAENDSTRIQVLSGSAELSFLESAGDQMFEGVLLAGQEIELTDEVIAEIFATGDEIARVAAWETKVKLFESTFEGEGRLVNTILNRLPDQEPNFFVNGFRYVKEKLIFNPSVKEDFYRQELAYAMTAAALGNTAVMQERLTSIEPEKLTLLKDVAAEMIPFTQLFLSEALLPLAQEKITRLAKLSEDLANFAELETLPSAIALNRDLVSITNDFSNTKLTQDFLSQTSSNIDDADTVSAKLLLQIMKKNPNALNDEWLASWNAINQKRITTDADLAEAIIDQLALAKFLISVSREELAGAALKELVSLLVKGSKKFSEASLEAVAKEGNELKNRIIFMASLEEGSEFDEEAYQAWLAEKERLENEKDEAEIPQDETEIEPSGVFPPLPENLDKSKVARPESEFMKFLNFEIPTSPTQAAEEEKLSE